MQRRYRRFFVILENEDLSNDKNQPKGHAKFEIKNEKGILTLNCQNLKIFKEKNVRYRWYLLNTKSEEPIIVDIGPMEVDENGKGELTWEFLADNVKASKNEIDQFNIVTLLVEAIGDKKLLEAPLVGYIEKDKVKSNWKGLIEKKLYGEFSIESKRATTRQLEAKVEEPLPSFEVKEVKSKEVPSKQSEVTPIPAATREKPVKAEEIQKEIPNEISKETSKEIPKEITKELPKELPQENQRAIATERPASFSFEEASDEFRTNASANSDMSKTNVEIGHVPAAMPNYNIPATERMPASEHVQKDTVQAYIEGTLKMFPKVHPFEDTLKDYQWWQLPYNYQTMYRAYMPFIAYIEGMRYPNYYFPYQYPSEYQRLIYMHQHYVFGISYDKDKRVKHYVYGIPGRRVITDQPYGGTTGFVYWHPCTKGSNDEPGPGYWIMHVDAKTGKIVTPIESTKL